MDDSDIHHHNSRPFIKRMGRRSFGDCIFIDPHKRRLPLQVAEETKKRSDYTGGYSNLLHSFMLENTNGFLAFVLTKRRTKATDRARNTSMMAPRETGEKAGLLLCAFKFEEKVAIYLNFRETTNNALYDTHCF